MGQTNDWNDPEWESIRKMTEAELRQELVDEGEDPDEIVAGLRRLGRVMAARYGDQIERERRMSPVVDKTLYIFAEAAAAGVPAWAEGAPPTEETSLFDALSKARKEDTFWARVKGWSMRDAGINDGDIVLVCAKQEAKDGDVVLAHLAGEGQVVKRLRLREGKAALESANPDFAPIEIDDPSKLQIHGVVVGRAGSV